jgi:hypothetical protein
VPVGVARGVVGVVRVAGAVRVPVPVASVPVASVVVGVRRGLVVRAPVVVRVRPVAGVVRAAGVHRGQLGPHPGRRDGDG